MQPDRQEKIVAPRRATHVPGRRYLTTGEAGARLHQSSYWVAQRIQSGDLEGYGIPREHRTKWYVFEDVIEALERADGPDTRPQAVEPLDSMESLLRNAGLHARNLREANDAERKASSCAFALAQQAVHYWLMDEPKELAGDIKDQLLEAYTARDEARGQLDRAVLDLQDALAKAQNWT